MTPNSHIGITDKECSLRKVEYHAKDPCSLESHTVNVRIA